MENIVILQKNKQRCLVKKFLKGSLDSLCSLHRKVVLLGRDKPYDALGF